MVICYLCIAYILLINSYNGKKLAFILYHILLLLYFHLCTNEEYKHPSDTLNCKIYNHHTLYVPNFSFSMSHPPNCCFVKFIVYIFVILLIWYYHWFICSSSTFLTKTQKYILYIVFLFIRWFISLYHYQIDKQIILYYN